MTLPAVHVRAGAAPLEQVEDDVHPATMPAGCVAAADVRRRGHVLRYAAAAWTGSARTMTVSTTWLISSAGRPARSACLRIASGLTAS